MKIKLFGKGKMGRMVERLAEMRGDSLVSLEEAEIAIDFSHPEVVFSHVQQACATPIPIVIGTTGWDAQRPNVKAYIEQEKGTALYAPNFSIGVNLFMHLLHEAKKLFATSPQYQVAGVERHHAQKIDAPSGTAIRIAEILDMKPPFSSIRCGSIPGTHEVLFDSPFDTITLTHTARNREGFAQGALEAAEWLIGKTGWYTLDDMLHSANHTL